MSGLTDLLPIAEPPPGLEDTWAGLIAELGAIEVDLGITDSGAELLAHLEAAAAKPDQLAEVAYQLGRIADVVEGLQTLLSTAAPLLESMGGLLGGPLAGLLGGPR